MYGLLKMKRAKEEAKKSIEERHETLKEQVIDKQKDISEERDLHSENMEKLSELEELLNSF